MRDERGGGAAVVCLLRRFRPTGGVRDGWQVWSLAIGGLYLYAAAVCAWGVCAFLASGDGSTIERTGLPIAIAMLMQVVLFSRVIWLARRARRSEAHARV